MGWTGDINVFARTAVYNMDAQAFLGKWLQDLRDTQRADGALPGVAPIIPGRFDGGYGIAGWADAGVHVPWTVWQAYGDTDVIAENYDSMKRYVDYLDADSTDHIRSAGGYLDWLNLDDPTPADVLEHGVRSAQHARVRGDGRGRGQRRGRGRPTRRGSTRSARRSAGRVRRRATARSRATARPRTSSRSPTTSCRRTGATP